MADDLSRTLKYPIFIIEHDRKHEFTGFKVVHRQTRFSAFGRVPNSQQYNKGQVFDSEGQVYKYFGTSGYPRFHPKVCIILDSLLIPGLISKLLAMFTYFGPNLVEVEKVDPEEIRSRIVSEIMNYGSKDIDQLVKILSTKIDYLSILEGVEWWIYHGGRRDEDGHPI